MTRIVFETTAGSIPVDSDKDISVMEVAKDNGVAGIDADCGGQMVCGTCHVFVDDADLRNFPPPDDMEEMILENVPDPQPNARLSCQLRVLDCADTIRFIVPPTQR